MNEIGIATEWLVIDGSPEFFGFTKDIHNGLQGEAITLRANHDPAPRHRPCQWRAGRAG